VSKPVTIFRTPRRFTVLLGLMAGAVAVGFVLTFRQQGLSLVAVGLAAFAALSVIGFLDAILTWVELGSDSLTFVTQFRRRRIARADIDSVTWASGCGVSIKLVTGGWVTLPETGNSQSRTNSIRAWLKRTAPPSDGPET
jgi:hypothetical protein